MIAQDTDFNDWRWQLRHQIKSLAQLEGLFELLPEEREAIIALKERFRLGITPYYLNLMDPLDENCPIRRQAIPLLAEEKTGPQEMADPLAEERDMPIIGLTQRYPNRALLYLSHSCAVYCRHCTRRRKVGDASSANKRDQIAEAIEWLKDNQQVNDVVLSGGDPLSWSDARLDKLLTALRPLVSVIRIGTRHPTTLPQRITPGLASVLSKHPPLYVMTHFNHPKECTPDAAVALKRLADAGCVLSNQSVLLKGINDDSDTLKALHLWLLENRCRPYRLFHCDYTEGVGHFRVSLAKGLEIIQQLRGHSSGLAIPEYVIDLPHGHGKVPVSEGVCDSDNRWTFRSWRGVAVTVMDENETTPMV